MIFRHFTDPAQNRNSYLVASTKTREAAIIDPLENCLSEYEALLDQRGLKLIYTFQTRNDRSGTRAGQTLRMRRASSQVLPFQAVAFDSEATDVIDDRAKPGASFALGDLTVETIDPLTPGDCEVSFRVCDYVFSPNEIRILDMKNEANDSAPIPSLTPAEIGQATTQTPERHKLITNCRTTRDGIPVEMLILEDLHSSLIENSFSPKEARVVRTYIQFLEDNNFVHPAASQLASMLENVDRTAVHVLVHNIRWKQIEQGRLPVVLSGQTSKWLRELQTKPRFTDHEKEFLDAYLRLVERNQRPPSGPDVARELSGDRSVQWIRKRAHTIRRKQKEFNQPILILSRKNPQPHPVRAYVSARGTSHHSNESAVRYTA
ncbi:MAG: hypothetical protein VX252_15110 [Myxococcota bacterium]|nr:hypothetical protein [Myxococcota bacterium]